MKKVMSICATCKAGILSIAAIAFAAHWILEIIAVASITTLACH
jgi:hypothetical protein